MSIYPMNNEKIFLMNQRSCDVRELPGTVMGLFLGNRKDEIHGGRIRVDSLLGNDSTFFFLKLKEMGHEER